ncbi:MAG: glycosyltransferase family 4 protein [Acidimicrobiales bacterium]
MTVIQAVCTDAFAGVERYVSQVSNGLARRDHRVTVVGGNRDRMHDELDPEVHRVPARTLGGVAAALASRPTADIVHVHMTDAEVAAWIARPFQRSPVVATRHFAQTRGSSAHARALTRVTARALAVEIAISRFVAERIEGPSELLYNGVADRPQAPLTFPTVVMLQRLEAEKAPDVGLRAWAESGLGRSGWRLVVAGDGALGPALVDLARNLEVTSSVDFVGEVADTAGLLASSSMLLAPAPREPFGLSVVEAMSQGIPVVAAWSGGHVETIGEAGAGFAPGDSSAAAGALATLAADHRLRSDTGARLRRRQRRLFTLEGHLDGLERIYDGVSFRSCHPRT